MFYNPFKRKPKEETRAAGMGFTADLMAAREAYISGRSGVADLTATAQACVALWEGGLGIADVDGTDLLNRRSMGLMGRSLALRGEAVFLIREDGLIPANDWDVRTRNGIPRAYRITISEAGGGNSETALAAEVLHVRIGSDAATPWHGTAPLRRARLTAGLLQSVETALAEVYDNAPLGSQIVPYPEGQETDMAALGRGFRGRRGQVLMRESVHVTAAGGPTPQTDWRPSDVTPDISKAMTKETLDASRDAVAAAFGVLPGMFYRAATGPVIREAQRHLVQWTLEPIAALIAEEATEKLGSPVTLDVARPLQAFDTGGRARALGAIVKAAAEAKAAGVSDDFAKALALVDWRNE